MSKLITKNEEKIVEVKTFPKREPLVEEETRKKQIAALVEKCAMYRNNIEMAKADLEDYNKIKDSSVTEITSQLKNSIDEWKKRLDKTKNELGNLLKKQEEVEMVIREIKSKIKIHNNLEIIKSALKAAAITYVLFSGGAYLSGSETKEILTNPAIFCPPLIVAIAVGVWYKFSPTRNQLLNEINKKIEKDKEDIQKIMKK